MDLLRILKWKDRYKDSEFKDSLIQYHSFYGWFKREVLECYLGKNTMSSIKILGFRIPTLNLFSFSIYEFPLSQWWKARKYFRRPKIKFFIHKVTSSSGYPFASSIYTAKVLHVYSRNCWWKDKWNSPRHERDPLIWICLFKKLAIGLRFCITYKNEFGEVVDGNMYYWEYLLDFLYYHKKLTKYSSWSSDSKLYKLPTYYGNAEDGSKDKYKPYPCIVPVVAMSLNKKGVKKLKSELKIC